MRELNYNFVVHSNEMACRKRGRLGLDRVATRYVIPLKKGEWNEKERYYQHETWANVHTKSLRVLLMNFHNNYQLWGNKAQKFLT